jgi:hypothetical protein
VKPSLRASRPGTGARQWTFSGLHQLVGRLRKEPCRRHVPIPGAAPIISGAIRDCGQVLVAAAPVPTSEELEGAMTEPELVVVQHQDGGSAERAPRNAPDPDTEEEVGV